ncbi:hypothetical protein PV682_20750 [Streptomyces niveiscabiei]|uniref:hypothetical protein n=1 Tax=Streptomyces niveiscabiei TaxID=164115 RepID=UPI0029ACB4CB|nr:hypothetical protein [Streptomyces niveiscabiei]MDX3383872.1 hypothetical protein [Streptomyces niveiscabiei]
MIAAEETFDGTLPYPARFNGAAGFRRHYVDVGKSETPQDRTYDANEHIAFEQILGNAGRTIAHLLIDLHHAARPEIATPTWIRAYSSPFPRQVLEGPQGTALLPEYVIPSFRLSHPDAPVVEVPGAGHFPTEDAPGTP